MKNGRLAQLGEHLPYKQRVIGSSPILSTKEKTRHRGQAPYKRLEQAGSE